jgi:predicted DCC family thiol-disulfide oxidoreductase YuxK
VLRFDRDRRLRPVALQDPEADTLLAGMAPDERMASWHLIAANGRVYSGGEAFEPLLHLIPGGDPLARTLGAVPPLADICYRAIASRRSLFGRLIPARSKARAQERIAAASGRT